jgi:hypothetical protein
LYANVSCSKDNLNFELLQLYLIFEDKKNPNEFRIFILLAENLTLVSAFSLNKLILD